MRSRRVKIWSVARFGDNKLLSLAISVSFQDLWSTWNEDADPCAEKSFSQMAWDPNEVCVHIIVVCVLILLFQGMIKWTSTCDSEEEETIVRNPIYFVEKY